jgi:spermidine synthase
MVLTPVELIYGLIGCAFAVLLGVGMAKKQARAFRHRNDEDANTHAPHNNGVPAVTCIDYGDMRFLHLGSPAVQGSMKISKPFDIHLDYVQRMMAWMLFADLEHLNQLHAMQLGLGAASLTKFCHHHLGIQTTAVELNPNVIETCRRSFHLPKDNAKLQVILDDAQSIASDHQWHGKIDALQVDLYDQDAARPVLDSEDFYRHCRSLLTTNGCMTVNLFGHAYSYAESLEKITRVFGADAVWTFKPTAAGNAIVLALHTPRPRDDASLDAQAQLIQARWPLPAMKWLKVLSPHPRAM